VTRRSNEKTPLRKFQNHKNRASRRGIAFTLTFEQWWELWEPHWDEMGRNKGCKVMCRYLDKGGYEPGNVRIDTVEGNAAERGLVHKISRPMWNRRKPNVKTDGWTGAPILSSRRFDRPDEAYINKYESDYEKA
jgi:hypothetical protein